MSPQLTPERWQRIDELFTRALEQAPSEQLPWLESMCPDDPDLVQAVVALLASARESADVLGESVSVFARTLVAEVQADLTTAEGPPLPAGGRIGPYRILRELGRGGMGAVYLAERADAEFEKRVAIKLVKRGMDTDEVLLRFRYERQILASLEHPNIARLYDGGAAEDGRPYLVMEHIVGVPITRYCDEHALPVDARLRLFAAVCEAVQFAHHNLVVHRDIKPSNILVDPEGRPKLLDFGIARLLDAADCDATPLTRTGLRLLTPEYASPEQRAGAPATTATDVYSLGLVLHELLTGRRPDAAREIRRPSATEALTARPSGGTPDVPAHEIARRRSTTPERLRRRLQGDLDTIVLRSLATEVTQRYASAEQLLADLQRHMNGLPVLARGESLRYRAAKFVRRHRAAVTAAALVVLSLSGGLGAAVWQAEQAAHQRDEAQLERARAEQVSSFVLSLFEAADPLAEGGGGDTLRVHSLVERAAGRVRGELNGQPRLQAQMMTTLGRAYLNLGLYAAARSLLDEAVTLAGDTHAKERAVALAGLADIAYWHGEHAAGDSLHRQVAALYEDHGWPHDAAYINTISRWGNTLEVLGRGDEALPLHERALDLVRTLGLEDGGVHSSALNNLGVHYWNIGDFERAEPLFREVVEINRKAYGPDHPELTGNLNNLANTVQNLGRLDEAEALYREAIDAARRAYGEEHVHVGQFLENLAGLLDTRQRYTDAEPLYREALRIRSAALGPNSSRVAMLKRGLAGNRFEVGDLTASEALLRESVAAFHAEYGREHFYTALAETSLGRTLNALGRHRESIPLLRASIATLQATAPELHQWRVHLGRVYLATALAASGDYGQAERVLLDAHAALLASQGAAGYATGVARAQLYAFYSARGQPERAAEYRPAPSQ